MKTDIRAITGIKKAWNRLLSSVMFNHLCKIETSESTRIYFYDDDSLNAFFGMILALNRNLDRMERRKDLWRRAAEIEFRGKIDSQHPWLDDEQAGRRVSDWSSDVDRKIEEIVEASFIEAHREETII